MRLSVFFVLVFVALATQNARSQEYNTELQKACDLYSTGDYKSACAIFDKWLPVAEKAISRHDTLYSEYATKAGRSYTLDNQYDKARSIFEDLMLRDARLKGLQRQRYANHVDNLGLCDYAKGEYRDALLHFEESRNIRGSILGKAHADYALSLGHIGALYVDMGNFVEALPLLTDALNTTRQTLGTHSNQYAIIANSYAIYYYETGDYKNALTFFEEAKTIREELLGKMHPDYAESVNNVAALYYMTGKYDLALPLYEEATAIDKVKLGEKNPEYARDLNNLAVLYKRTGKMDSALALLQRACPIYRNALGDLNPNYASCLFNTASVLFKLGRFEQSLPIYQKVLEIRRKSLGDTTAEYARTLNDLALNYSNLCNYEAAVSHLRKAVAIYRKSLGQGRDYGQAINNLGNIYAAMGRFDEALPLLEEGLSVYKRTIGTKHSDYAVALNYLAMLYSELGNFEKTIQLLREAVAVDREAFKSNNAETAIDLMNLANHYGATGKYDSAYTLLNEAISIFKEAYGTQHYKYAVALNNKARLLSSQSRYIEALNLFDEALSIIEPQKSVNQKHYAMLLKNKAIVLKETGQYSEAIPLLQEAAEIYIQIFGNKHPEYILCIKSLAEIYMLQKDYASALPYFMLANATINGNLQSNFLMLTGDEKRKYIDYFGNFYDLLLNFILLDRSDSLVLDPVGYNNELMLKGLVLSSVAGVQRSIMESGDTTLTRSYEAMRMLKRRINSLQLTSVSERSDEINALEQQASQLESELTRKSKTFTDIQDDFRIKWESVKNSLNDDETVIEFARFRNYFAGKNDGDKMRYCAFIVRKDFVTPKMVYLCSEKKLMTLTGVSSGSYKTINELYSNSELYNQLLKPLEPYLQNCTSLYYAPTGLINGLSLAAIPIPGNNRLMEKYHLVRMSSTRLLTKPKEPETLFSAVVYGGIDYNSDSSEILSNLYPEPLQDKMAGNRSFPGDGNGFAYLPGTMKEAGMVAEKLKSKGIKTQLLTGSRAMEESMIAVSGNNSPSLIHLATHGYYFPDSTLSKGIADVSLTSSGEKNFRLSDDPLNRSGLIMSGANKYWKGTLSPSLTEDGILTAKEVSNLNLLSTQLVVLSACNSGKGDIKGNEGVEGLQRGFKIAGVHYIINSLWEVPDKETAEFMLLFYENWLEKAMTIRNAFNQAQADMSRKYPAEPFRWASFVLVE